MAVDLNSSNRKRSFILREIKLYFRETLANSMLFPKQAYLYGVLTPFKGLHP